MRARATSTRAMRARATIGIIIACALVASTRAFDDAWLDDADVVDEPRGWAFESEDGFELALDASEEIGYEDAFDVREDASFGGRDDAAAVEVVEEVEAEERAVAADARGVDADDSASVGAVAVEENAAVENEVVVVDEREVEDAPRASGEVEEASGAGGDSATTGTTVEVVPEVDDEERFFESSSAPSPVPPDSDADASEPSEDSPTMESRSLEAVESEEDEEEHAESTQPSFFRGFLSQFGVKSESSDDSIDVVVESAAVEESIADASEAVVAEPVVESVDVVEAVVTQSEVVVTPEPEVEPVIVPESVPAQVDKPPEPVAKVVESNEEHNNRRRLLQTQQAQQPASQEPPPAKAEIVYVGGYYKRANPWAKGPRVRSVD